MVKIATYGSLKRGFYNHGRMGAQHYIGDMKVRGKMCLMFGSYPKLMLSDDGNEHDVEVFNVDNLTFELLDSMERGAGYTPINIHTPYGEAVMWVVTSEKQLNGTPIEAYTNDLIN